MFDKRRAAAEAANHTTIGFFNGIGFVMALLAIPFLLAHALFIAPVVIGIVAARRWLRTPKSQKVDRA
jgi:hypothetical protein